MEAYGAYGCLSVALAFASGSLAYRSWARSLERRRTATLLGASAEGFQGYAAWRLQRGFSCCMPLARVALRSGAIRCAAKRAVRVASDRGIDASDESILSVFAMVGACLVVATGVLADSILCGFAVAVCAGLGMSAWLKACEEKRRDAMRECVPDTLRAMSSCFASGLSVAQTFRQVAKHGSEPLRPLFDRGARILETGGTVKEALSALADPSVPEFAFVSVALDVQHQTGGPIVPILETACSAAEGELGLARSLRVQTAQAKLSARIVVIMPFALVALFSLVSDDFLAPFFESLEGLAMLAMALVLQLAGVLSTRRLLYSEARP